MNALDELFEVMDWNDEDMSAADLGKRYAYLAPLAAAELAAKNEEISNLKAELETQSNAAVSAINSIAELLGVGWDYPGQVVRDVAALTERVGRLERIEKAAKAVLDILSKTEIIDIDDKEFNVWSIVGDAEKDELAAALQEAQ